MTERTIAISPVEHHLPCDAHPEDGSHECMPDEQRCAYCGRRVVATCNGCGHFMTTAEIHSNESRCSGCA